MRKQEIALLRFILRLLNGASEFNIQTIAYKNYESFDEMDFDVTCLGIFGEFESLEDDEYSKYVNFEISFSFCSTILTFNEQQVSAWMKRQTLYSYYLNSHLHKKYKAFRDEQKLLDE